jgi:hypothetical protein
LKNLIGGTDMRQILDRQNYLYVSQNEQKQIEIETLNIRPFKTTPPTSKELCAIDTFLAAVLNQKFIELEGLRNGQNEEEISYFNDFTQNTENEITLTLPDVPPLRGFRILCLFVSGYPLQLISPNRKEPSSVEQESYNNFVKALNYLETECRPV